MKNESLALSWFCIVGEFLGGKLKNILAGVKNIIIFPGPNEFVPAIGRLNPAHAFSKYISILHSLPYRPSRG